MASPLEKYYDVIEDYEKIAIRYNVKIEGPALKPEDDPEVVDILSAVDGIKKTLALDVLYGDKEKTDEDVEKAIDAGENGSITYKVNMEEEGSYRLAVGYSFSSPPSGVSSGAAGT